MAFVLITLSQMHDKGSPCSTSQFLIVLPGAKSIFPICSIRAALYAVALG